VTKDNKNEKRRLNSAKGLKKLNEDYYAEARSAHEQGNHIAWITAVFPVEILCAMDIVPMYPENHAVFCAARHMTEELSEEVEARGYSRDLCAYTRCDLGSLYTGKSPIGGVPEPDFLLACNTQCGTLSKWFEVLNRHFGAPVFLLDSPFVYRPNLDPGAIFYFETQIRELIGFLEHYTGKKLNMERLEQALHYSDRGCRLWNDILDMAANVPSPLTYFDESFLMAPIVNLRGRAKSVEFYEAVRDELKEWVNEGYAAIPGERFRIYWEEKPFWFALREMSQYFAERKAAILCSLYTHAWSYRFDPKDPIGTLARNYATVYPNLNFDQRVEFMLDYMRRYHLHGLISHGNRSCKGGAFGMVDIEDMIEKEGGYPGIVVDGDMSDSRFFSSEQVYNRIDAFLEALAVKYGI
jgi:benzoyl-CoA reductase/2-hydroxyglutaryl-CoA dehydratase subunit BcrC/BadD/HgdB